MKLCGSVNWCRIGWLVVTINLLLVSSFAWSQNIPPVLNTGIPNQHTEVGASFSYTIPSSAFKDANGDNLTYSVTSSPSGASISGRTISASSDTEAPISINVTANDGNGGQASTSFTIFVHPAGGTYAAFTMNTQMGCGSQTIQFINRSNNAETFDWDLGNGNHSSLPNPIAIYTEPGTYSVTLTINNNPELSFSDAITIFKNPSPSINRSGLTGGCEPYSVTLTSTGNAGVYYHWYSEEFPAPVNRYTPTGSLNLSNLPNKRYNVSLEVTDANGCSGLIPYQPLFEVYDKPKASFSYDKTDDCRASLTNFTNTSTVEGSTITGHSWTIDGSVVGTDKDLSYNFTSAGKYVVSLTETSANNCTSDIFTDTVVFNNGNNADFSFSPSTVCKGTDIQFTPIVSPGIVSYDWIFEGTHVSNSNPSWNFNNAGNNQASLTASFNDGCIITVSKQVPIDEITPVISDSVSGVCLNNFTLYLNDNSTSAIGAEITSVKWSRDMGGNNFQSFTPPLSGLSEGTYRIKLEVTDATGCDSSVVKDITLSNSSLSFSTSGSITGCAGAGETNFTTNFQSGYDQITSYSWDFGDGTSSSEANPTHTFSNGNFNVTLSVTTANGCPYTHSETDVVQFANPPEIDSIRMIQNNYCMNSGVTFNTYYTSGTDLIQYTTNETPSQPEEVEVGGTSDSYTHKFKSFGNFNLTAVAVDNGCPSAPVSVSNIRIDGPKASFSTASSFCNVLDVNLSNGTTTNGSVPIYSWSFGDGNSSTETSPTHLYAEAGDYTVSLTATDTASGCSDSYQQTISIFTFDNSANNIISVSDNSGCAPLNDVSFSANITSKVSNNFNNYTLVWDFNDGSPDTTTNFPTVQHTFEEPGIYTTELHITGNGCDFTTSYGPITAQGPNIDFSISSPACSGSPVTFTNNSTQPAGGTASSFEWNFDGNTFNAASPGNTTYTFPDDGTKNVLLKITDSNSCYDTLSKNVTIEPFSADFTASSTTVCVGNAVTFTNNSGGEWLTYNWNFGDGETSSATNDSHTYNLPGDYTVTLEVKTANGCIKAPTQNIHVVNASADFLVSPTEIGCAPADASFTPVANDADVESYWWDFGDGTTAEERAQTHRYYTPGTYNVSLIITFTSGCNAMATKIITVDGAKGELNYSGLPSCSPNEVQFTLTNMSKVDKIQWDFGNGDGQEDFIASGTSTFSTSYTYTNSGYTKPSVMLTSNECLKSYAYEKNSSGINDPIRIYTSLPPDAQMWIDRPDICQGVDIQFRDASIVRDALFPGSKWEWDFGDGVKDTLQNPVHAYQNNAGSFSPTLIVSNAKGCSDTLTLNNGIYIHNRSEIQASIDVPENDNSIVCPGSPVHFNGSATTINQPVLSWEWHFDDGGSAFAKDTDHAYSKSFRGQTMNVLLVATDNKLCSDSTIRTVAINSLQAALGYSPQPVHRGVSVDFSDLSAFDYALNSWRWSFTGGIPSSFINNPNPGNIVFNTINTTGYPVSLEVSDVSGCSDDITVLLPILNNPPELESFNINTLINTRYYFSVTDFENHFTDKDAVVGQQIQGIQIVGLPSNGKLYFGSTEAYIGQTISRSDIGSLNYLSPNEGPDAFLWNATDGTDYSGGAAAVNIQVNPIPPAPTLSDLVFNIREDSVLTFSMATFRNHFTNSLMFEGFGLHILRLMNTPASAQGTLTYNSNQVIAGEEFTSEQIEDGYFTITPAPGYDGTISFDWNGFDSLKWGENPAKVIVNYINAVPVLTDIERNNLKQDEVQTITRDEFFDHYSDTDKNDSPETFYLNIPSDLKGTFKINNSPTVTGLNSIPFANLVSVTFTPSVGFEGLAEVMWGISDGQDTGNAAIRFNYVNALPVAHDVFVSGTEDKILLFRTSSFDTKPNPFEDSDVNDKLEQISIETLPENGFLRFKKLDGIYDTISSYYSFAANLINLRLEFIPDKDWNGTTSFTYKASDGTNWSTDEATVWISLAPVNDPPYPNNDSYTILEDEILSGINVMANDSDVDDPNTNLTVSVLDDGTAGQNGKITIHSDGELIYTPNLNFNDTVSFTYSICDTSKACATATVTIIIVPVNDPPSSANDTITIFDNTKFYTSVDTTRLLYNDWDPEGDSMYVSKVGYGNPGDTVLGNSGKIIAWKDGNYTYIPDSAKVISLDENEVFIDSFQYVAADYPEGLTSSAWLMIRIKGLNTPPVANNDTVWVDENSILDFDPTKTLLTNDFDPDSNLISVTKINEDSTGLINGTTGILSWKNDGQFHYQQGEKNDFFDYISEGDTAKVQFSYTISDGKKSKEAQLFIIINGKNDRPIAKNDQNNLLETDDNITSDSTTYLLVNDTEIDRGDSIFISMVMGSFTDSITGKWGWLRWHGDGSYTYFNNRNSTELLPAGEIVTDQFAYTVSDLLGSTASAILTITITGVNDIPNAQNDTLRMKEHDRNGSLTAGIDGLLDNDSDIDGDKITVSNFNNSSNKTFDSQLGTITWDSLGNIDFVIDSISVDSLQVGETVSETFWYIASDPSGGTTTSQLIVVIDGENDNPVAVNDSVSITEKTDSISGSVANGNSLLSNDSDVENDPVFATLVNGLSTGVSVGLHGYGELHWDSTGAYTYFTNRAITDTLAQDEIVTDWFGYTITDSYGGTDTASFIIEITGINDPPEAVPDSNSTTDIKPIVVIVTDTTNVLYNDYDVDGHKRKLTAVNSDSVSTIKEGNYGTLSWSENGSYAYQPEHDFAESLRPLEQVTDTFTYQIKDEFLASDTAWLQLTIVGINNAPLAYNDTLVVYEDDISRQLPAPGLLAPKNVQDPDRDTLKLRAMTGSENYGSITWDSAGKVIYTPDPKIIHQLGYEQVITESFSYTIVDEGGLTARANLIVKIIGENDPLTANRDFWTTEEDSFLKYNVIKNDTDLDYNKEGNFDYSSLTILEGPFHGKASRNSVTGEIYYFPEKDFYGNDSLIYQISDTGEPVYSDTAWFVIKVNPVNDPPVATHLILKTPMNTPVGFEYQKQVTDIDDGVDPNSLDTLLNNKLTISGNQIIYTPATDSTGIDEFTYSMKDFSGEAAYVIVTVIIGDTLSKFSAQDDYISTWEDTPVDIFILENDAIGDETPDPRTLEIKVFPANGVAIFDPVKEIVHYQPDKDFYGIDSLEYIVSSGPGNWDFAKVFIAVSPVNDPLIATDDVAETFINNPVTISVLANDFDPDNGIDTTSFQLLLAPKLGTAIFNISTGKLIYSPSSTIGIDSLTYKICDRDKMDTSCDSALVIILVEMVNSGFIAQNDTCSTKENKPCTLNPLANDYNNDIEIPTDSTTLKILSGPLDGKDTINTDYTVTYTPRENYFGPDWMEYIVADSTGNWDKAEINIWVNEVNIAPVAVNDTVIVTRNEFKRLYVLENDYDLDGTLNWTRLDTVTGKGPKNGEIVIDRNTGTILYKPTIHTGKDQFTYRIYDNQGLFDEATVYVTIELETSIYIRRSTNEDTPVTIDIAAEMVKYNLTFTIEKVIQEIAPELGAYSFTNSNRELTYTPDLDLNGKDTIWLSVWSKDNADFASLRIFITIIPVNDAPVAIDDTIHWIFTSDAKIITFDSLLVNDYDVDGDQILLTDSVIQTGYDDLHVVFNSDSTITITANTILWCNAWFTYEIKDQDGLLDTAKVWIFPKLEGINANNDQTTVWERGRDIDYKLNLIDVLSNDVFVDNQRCTIDTIIIITQPQHGTAIGTPDNFVDYSPTRHYFGPDSLQYLIIDIWGQSSSAWVYIEVEERNTPPIAVNDVVAYLGAAINIPVLDNDYDPDAEGTDGDPNAHIIPDSTRMTIGSDPQYGIVTFDPVNFIFIYTPDAMSCIDSFQYTIFDNEHGSDTATVIINFNEAPIFANSDNVKTYPGVEVEVEPLLNDSGYFVPELTTHTIPLTIHGTVNWNYQNVVTYIPDKSFIGKDSILYTLISPCGIEKKAYIVFNVEELRVPEIISPNGDNKNDVLIIDGIEYFPDNLLQIYNRYGHIVYQKKGYLNEWGGYSNKGSLGGDKPLPAGTYYYTLIYNEGRNRQAGFVYLFW